MAQIFISLGSNIDKEHNVRSGIDALKKIIPDLVVSDVFESEPIGFSGSNFYNLVCGGHIELSVEAICQLLRQIEVEHGRVRSSKKFSSRTLDLDLLVYDNLIIDHPAQLPRDEITKNAFVLWPLAQIAPEVTHPIAQHNYQTLWQAFDKSNQPLWVVNFNW